MTARDGDDGSLADVNMAAASLRSDTREIQALLRALVDALSGVLGSRLQVDYGRGLLGKLIGDIPYVNPRSRTIRSMSLFVGSFDFRIVLDGHIRCEITRVPGTNAPSGGEGGPGGRAPAEGKDLTLADWAQALLEALNAQAQVNAASREALERLVAS